MLAKLGKKIAGILGDTHTIQKTHSYFQEAFQKMSEFYKISDLFPYESYDIENHIFYNADSLGFVIETSPLVGSSDTMQREISNLFTTVLPDESALQVLLYADPHIGDCLNGFVDARCDAQLKTLYQKRINYLKTFSYDSPFKPYTLRNFRVFLSVTLKKTKSEIADKESLMRIQSQMKTTLEMVNCPVSFLTPERLLSLLHGVLFPQKEDTNSHKMKWNRFQSIADQLSSDDKNIMVQEKDLLLNNGEVTVRSYSVREFPFEWSLHAMNRLIGDQDRDQAQIPCPFIFHYGVYIPKQNSLKTKLMAKTSYVEKQAYSPIGKYLPDIQKEAEELTFVRDQMGRGERLVQTHFNVILLSETQKIESSEQMLLNLFTSNEWKLESNRYLHFPIFLSSMPMMWGEEQVRSFLNLKKIKTTLSTESANLLPLQGEWMGTKTKAMLLSGRRGQIFGWYPFDNDTGNYNTCVVGRSGSGKSVFMQELMTSTLGLGGRVFVLDVGRSFEKTCFLLNGQFIEFTPKTPICLNPFSTISIDDEVAAEDALAMLKTILILMAAPSHGVDDKGAALLEQAMLETWQIYKNETTITKIAEYLISNDDPKANDLGQMLYPYTKNGTYGRFFEGKSTVNFKNQLVVIELEELKERKDLQAVIVQMVIVSITNQMFLGDRKVPFNIVFDEAWDMLKGNQSGVFIETLARRLRKYRGSLIVGTQSINDFFVSPGAQAAFDNSDWMCLLSQKPESIEYLKKRDRLSLTPQKEALLKSVKTKQGEYAEVMITGSNGYAVGRLILDPFSGLLYSTKAEDYTAIQHLRERGFSLSDAINQLNIMKKTKKVA